MIHDLGEIFMPHEKVKQWKDKNEHLPMFLRTAEAQASFIKLLGYYYTNEEKDNPFNNQSWSIIKKYIFSVFLDYMADNGLTLQRIRHKTITFLDPAREMDEFQLFDKGENESYTQQTTNPDMLNKIERYRRNLLFLPTFMNEFDNFKYVFRSLHANHDHNDNYVTVFSEINDRVGACIIIDHALWFLSKYGYKLMLSRKKLPFDQTL